jgi:hypothetical protein
MSMLAALLIVTCEGGRVELEIILEQGTVGNEREWLESLQDVGADSIRMRSGKSGDRVGVSKSATGGATTYKVTGVLTADNRLQLPGGTFRKSELRAVAAWIAKLKSGEADNPQEEKLAFGLNAEQLVALHEKMSASLSHSTKGVRIREVFDKIRQRASVTISVHESAKKALQGEETVLEELQSLSVGTALASVIRPLGLVAVPQQSGGRLSGIQIMLSQDAEEHWPIGWPLQESPGDAAPKLFEFLEVDIDDFALNDTLDAIEAKVGIPFLYDQNSLAKNDIEMKDVRVTVGPEKTYYYKVIRRVVAQTRPQMKVEVRADEAGNPFLWFSTYR